MMGRKKLTKEEKLQRQLEKLSPAELDALETITLAQYARLDDSPESFAAFYKVIHNKECPVHALDEWVTPLYEAREKEKGIVIEAFRGSTKTTTITITFTAYRIGKSPECANLLIQVGDDIADDNTQQIADIIENNPGWKLVFPHVEPDRGRGWGAGGYEVKRTDIEYAEWRSINSGRKDPTLLGVGYKSRAIIGKHPDGVLVVDDIHDENNTSSARELEKVKSILKGTIFPTEQPTTWSIFIGTPWVLEDTLHYTAATGEYVHVKTPVYRAASNGKGESFDGQEVMLTWGKEYSIKEITKEKNKSGHLEFARMYLLDLTAAQNRVFKYMSYPNSEIKADWVMVGGVDYASHRDAYMNKEAKGDYFAMAYGAKLPMGGCVIVDGVLDNCTQAQGEIYVNRAQAIFPRWQSSIVESVGKGDDFVQTIMRNPQLRIIPMHSGARSKSNRLEKELGPWLENGTIRISDAETPFLIELRRELDNYPFNSKDDAMDAVYYATVKGMPDVLAIPVEPQQLDIFGNRKEKQRNPFLSLGRT